jgi:hypothetical protein
MAVADGSNLRTARLAPILFVAMGAQLTIDVTKNAIKARSKAAR